MNAIISIVIYVAASIAFITIGPLVLLITFINPSNSSKYIIPFCKFMIIVFGCKLKVYGDFPKNETFVIMANHVSFLDVFAIPCALDTTKKFSAVAASKNFKIPIYSIFLKKMRAVSIDRSNKEQSIKGIQEAEKILTDNYHIVILPEGTRTLTGSLGNLKKGGFHLAANTRAKILPIITKGLFTIKPTNRWNIKPGLIEIYIDKPITTSNKTVDELKDETEKIFRKYF
jgi:1-acyl-sn-glycerol-3-phosphate acyltransferase